MTWLMMIIVILLIMMIIRRWRVHVIIQPPDLKDKTDGKRGNMDAEPKREDPKGANRVLREFEIDVNEYLVKTEHGKTDVQHLRKFCEHASKKLSLHSDSKHIADVREALEKSSYSLDNLKTCTPTQFIKGCLNIASPIFAIVGGPYGAVASTICGILKAILLQNSQSRTDSKIYSNISEVIHKEFLDDNLEKNRQHLAGLKMRVKNVVSAIIISQVSVNDGRIVFEDDILFEKDFPQFIGQLIAVFTKIDLSKRDDLENIVKTIAMYCEVQMLHFLLLSAIVIGAVKSNCNKAKDIIERRLESAMEDSVERLAFLSYKDREGLKSPEMQQHITLGIFVQDNPDACKVIKEFRESLGMTEMMALDDIRKLAIEALYAYPADVLPHYSYTNPHKTGVCHYFQMINNTDSLFIRIASNGKSKRNGLKLKEEITVRPHGDHSQPVSASKWRLFNSKKCRFYIDLDGEKQSHEDIKAANTKSFEFMLSNGILGNGLAIQSILHKEDHWNRMDTDGNPAIYFNHQGKYFIVFGEVIGGGEKGCRTWRFVVQEYPATELCVTGQPTEKHNQEDYKFIFTKRKQKIPNAYLRFKNCEI